MHRHHRRHVSATASLPLQTPHGLEVIRRALGNNRESPNMKRSSSTRVARKIGSYDDDESADSTNSSQSEVQKPTG